DKEICSSVSRFMQPNDTNALNTFIKIQKAKNILNFAKRYGPLGLCKHGLPPMHRGEDGERRWCSPNENEPIERWFYYVKIARLCLEFAAQMKVEPGKITVPAKYLKKIAPNHPKPISDSIKMPVRGLGKLVVTDYINEWLGDAGLRFILDWNSREPRLIITSPSVFGALGIQLLSVVTRTNLAVCSGCGMPYLREGRKPQAGRRNFCTSCGYEVATRLRQRDKRERDK
ncbi:hypothetical protein ACFLWM_02095, partial [Chloroflexota bacterium]